MTLRHGTIICYATAFVFVMMTAGMVAGNVIEIPEPVSPVITRSDPASSSVSDYIGDSRTFTVNVSQIADVTWILDGTILHTNQSVRTASYCCSSDELGVHNLTILAQNEIGMDQKCWDWVVSTIPVGIKLFPGWHFISVPCELCDPGIDHVLECVAYDALTCYNAETCSWETVSAIEPSKGYWIHIPEGCGTQVIPEEALEPAVTPYKQATQIFKGWNAIGCCESADALSAEMSLACIDDCYTCIWGPWNPVTMSYEYFGHNGESGLISGRHLGTDSFEMEKYRGYWVYATSNTVLVENEDTLIDRLSDLDAFHPPASDENKIMLYNEWHYFNVVDEEHDLSFVITLKLNGDIYDLSGNTNDPFSTHANVMLSYHTPAGANITIDGCPMTQVEYSDITPDLRIGNSDTRLTNDGYEVHVESSDGQTVFDAVFEPECEPAPVFSAPYEPDRVINWQSASPKMEVDGTLTINKGTPLETTYTLSNARGYHDHNWGYWLWQDDIGWKWGQASEGNTGKYTFSFGNVTNNDHTESKGSVLDIWEDEKIIAIFTNDELNMQHYMMSDQLPDNPFVELLPDNTFPLITVINAVSDDDGDMVSIEFNTEHFMPIPIPTGEDQYLVIWEVFGTYDVNGYVAGNPVSYTTKGFMEYVA
ncbi:MAG: hypothetical protein JXA98_05405 [Methanosarcinaceae archaeon]|nr:hypothetical protein [Methanosarcinaceae archaeon]